MTVKERIAALRDKMRANGIDAYIVFDSDEHMSEYLPEYYRERSWISGFTGSAGTVVVTQQEAGLWTDGRYYLQAANQLSGSGVTLFRASDAGVISLTDYLFKSVSLRRHHCPQRTGGFHCHGAGTARKMRCE